MPSGLTFIKSLAVLKPEIVAICLSALIVAFAACIVCAVSSRRKLKHMAALLFLAIGMTIAAQKDLTNGTDGVSAPMPPMMQMGRMVGDPPPADEPSDSVTNETESAQLEFTSFFLFTNGVGFAAGWIPGLGLAYLDLRYSEHLDTDGWNILDRWAVSPTQTNDTRFIPYGGSFTNAATGFFGLRGYTYDADPDGDRLSVGQELRLGTDPFAADTDGDGSSDGEELGTVAVLTGDDFLWFDMPSAFNRVRTDRDSYWWLDDLDDGFRVCGERLGRIESSIDGFTHFYVSEIPNALCYGWYDDAMAFRTNSLSGGFLTVAAANADLYARPDAWGSAFRYASVTTNGVTYYVLQCANLGLKANRTGESPLLSYEVFFSEDVPDVVYVSYGRVDEGIRSLDMKLGVQVAAWRNPLATNEYYTLMSPVAGSNLCAGTTIRYGLGAATDPLAADTDGDGVPDGSDPLPHDAALGSYGQDETWVRMNFTNSEEILSVGYANWVDAQVGVGLTNGLYKFTATFPAAPAEPTRLTVGGVPVLVNAAGDYVFLLEKGTEYSFDTDPFAADVTYAQADDLVASPVVPDTTQVPRQWTVGGGEVSLVEPTATAPGSTLMMPVLLVTPDVTQAGWHSFPMTFSAFLSDCRDASGASFLWAPGNDSVEIASPHSPSTSVYGQMAYDETFLSVSTAVNGRTLTAELRAEAVNEGEDIGAPYLHGPDAILPGECVEMTFGVNPLVETNGILRLDCVSPGGQISLWEDAYKTDPIVSGKVWNVTNSFSRSLYVAGLNESRYIRDSFCVLTFVPQNGMPAVVTNWITVISVGDVVLNAETAGGLAVLTNTDIQIMVRCSPDGASSLLSSEWYVCRMKSDESYENWQIINRCESGVSTVYTPMVGGIYRVKANVELGGNRIVERIYRWKDDENPELGSRTKGDIKSFGVCSEEWQLTLRNRCLEHLGSTAYAYDRITPAYDIYSDVPAQSWKCNVFVAHRLAECGMPVPVEHRGRSLLNRWPPLANEWADRDFEIANWCIVPADGHPEPGLVAALRREGGTGHIGVLDFDGAAISAQGDLVTRLSRILKYDNVLMRKFNGGESE